MEWSLKPAAKNKEWLNKVKLEQGIKISSLDAEPVIRLDILWIWEVFCELNRARGTVFTGGGVMHTPITYAEIYYYCSLNSIEDARSKMLLNKLIPAMDRVYMIDHIESIAKQNKKAK